MTRQDQAEILETRLKNKYFGSWQFIEVQPAFNELKKEFDDYYAIFSKRISNDKLSAFLKLYDQLGYEPTNRDLVGVELATSDGQFIVYNKLASETEIIHSVPVKEFL